MGTPPMGPPPDATAAVPDVNRTGKERAFDAIGGMLSAGSGQDPASSPLQQEMNKQHQVRLANARRHFENATTYGANLGLGEIDPQSGEPTGMLPDQNNPGKLRPMTPEERAQYKQMMEGAWGDYQKAAGVSKEAKGSLQKHKGILDLLVTKGHKALQGVMDAHKQATSAISPPPQPGAQTPTQATSPPATSGSTLPPPPSPSTPTTPAYNPQSAAQVPALRQGMADWRSGALDEQKEEAKKRGDVVAAQAGFDQRQKWAKDLNMDPSDTATQEFVTTGKWPTVTKPQKMSSGVLGEKLAAMGVTMEDGSPVKPGQRYELYNGPNGQFAVPSGTKEFVGEGKLETVAGMPTGRVMHNGKFVAPGDPSFTAEDKKAVEGGITAQGLTQTQKEKLMAIRGEAYARARAMYQFKSVIDKETGEATEVSALDMAKEPGKYSEPSEQEKIAARDAVHKSLNVNFDKLEQSLNALPDGLDTETQGVIRLAIRQEDPGILDTLITNKVKENADPRTIQYLTNIKAMQEDVMTLRSVGGITGSSDALRSAMVNLVPGPGTSSVMEAKMQIAAAKRTSEALFSGRPQSTLGPGNKVPPPPAPKGSATKPGAPKVIKYDAQGNRL